MSGSSTTQLHILVPRRIKILHSIGKAIGDDEWVPRAEQQCHNSDASSSDMSMSYNPSDGATYDSFWAPIFLGYRDITGQAPIDKVSYPGVSIKAVCSPNNVFDINRYETCISNLLGAEFRRFIFDLYWDTANRRFNLCPVELPHEDVNSTAPATSITPTPTTLTTNATSTTPRNGTSSTSGIAGRQIQNVTGLGTSISSVTSSSTISSSTVASTTAASGSTLYQLGQYQCSQDLTLQSVLKLFDDYIDSTSNEVLARMLIMELNLHAAASLENPDGPAPAPSSEQMPSGSELVSNTINNDDLKHELYTPSDLSEERSNLNASWYAVGAEGRLPFTYYFTVSEDSNGYYSTSDGWPNEEYLLFNKLVRMLVSWGTVDQQMEEYNFDNDSSTIFPQGYMQRDRGFEANAAGSVTSGCFYDDQTTNVARVNDTWAMGFIQDTQNAGQEVFVSNLTACGIGPILNISLSDSSPADNYTLYQRFSEAAVFGWASGEPRNTTSPGADVDGGGDQYRCVVLDSSEAYRGQWKVDNCQKKHRAACRVNDQPYNWRLTSNEVIYGDAPDACQDSTYFSLPRTGLENTYLYQHVLDDAITQEDAREALSGVWINLNSLDTQNCWVTSGPDGNCLYARAQDEKHTREVLIPTIAALIALILSVLTILIKCNNNIRHNRRSKTGPGGWEYEGVPS